MISELCKCGRARRPGQRYCQLCHSASMRASRGRRAARAAELEHLVALGAFDPETKRRFEARFATRLVVVLADSGSVAGDRVGFVVGFKPDSTLVIADHRGREFEAKLHQLQEDPSV